MSDDFSETIIGEDINFKGKLKFNRKLQIRGKFKGTIETSGELTIGETGDVHADIHASTLGIYGSLRGNVEVTQKVHLGKTGRISGDIKTPLLEIESGAKFTGNCVM
ncbi:MAG: polymer-forming cytoskeletal protein [Leptospira sp.]|nr:polymer-forming cytoskeletal protein [Leptospira sp.]